MTTADDGSQPLAIWLLTLPFVTSPDCDLNVWKDPDSWPGDWQIWRNRHTMVVAAAAESDARRLAAEDDCAVWLDPAYALCRPLIPDGQGVVLTAGGGAENE